MRAGRHCHADAGPGLSAKGGPEYHPWKRRAGAWPTTKFLGEVWRNEGDSGAKDVRFGDWITPSAWTAKRGATRHSVHNKQPTRRQLHIPSSTDTRTQRSRDRRRDAETGSHICTSRSWDSPSDATN